MPPRWRRCWGPSSGGASTTASRSSATSARPTRGPPPAESGRSPRSEASRGCGWRSSRGTTCPTPAASCSCARTSPPNTRRAELLSANAYIGAAAIAEALGAGAGGGHRARGRPVAGGRAGDGPFRLVRHGLGRARPRHHRRAPDRVRAQVTGGYFADPGIEGSARSPRGRIPHRGDRGRGWVDDREGGRDRRSGGRPHGEGAAPLRDARPRGLRHARRRGGHLRRRGGTARPGPGRGPRGPRPAADGDAQGAGLLRGRVAGGGRDLLRRAERRGPGRGWPRTSSADVWARAWRFATT